MEQHFTVFNIRSIAGTVYAISDHKKVRRFLDINQCTPYKSYTEHSWLCRNFSPANKSPVFQGIMHVCKELDWRCTRRGSTRFPTQPTPRQRDTAPHTTAVTTSLTRRFNVTSTSLPPDPSGKMRRTHRFISYVNMRTKNYNRDTNYILSLNMRFDENMTLLGTNRYKACR